MPFIGVTLHVGTSANVSHAAANVIVHPVAVVPSVTVIIESVPTVGPFMPDTVAVPVLLVVTRNQLESTPVVLDPGCQLSACEPLVNADGVIAGPTRSSARETMLPAVNVGAAATLHVEPACVM